MERLSKYIYNLIDFCGSIKQEKSVPVLEMSTISKSARFGNQNYRVAIHGPAVGDRPYPHIHIYKATDKYPFNNFNFEISLVDLLCYDELNLVAMVDKANKVSIKNRNKCSWKNYRKLRDDFEDWLGSKSDYPGAFRDNLDAIIWNYNNESYEDNALINYIEDQSKKVLSKYQKYFN